MASATVAVKLTPFELQVVDLSLRLLFETARAAATNREKDTVRAAINFELFDNDPSRAARAAQMVRVELGLH
jgi:hypothetical protein